MKAKYIFETSWEVCNKVGGIYTVISTKAITLKENCTEFICIGPECFHESSEHPEFEEDNTLFADWHKIATNEGLKFRIGRWKIPGNPIVFLVNFTDYFNEKDKIFAKFWEDYKLDSLTGQWDYTEPALFGYAAGKIIESFTNHNLCFHDKIVAQFHEWMTGTGILYLKKNVPHVATAFTTHATAVGRCLAGNRKKLYKHLNDFNGDLAARDFNIIAKQSLEKISAQNADVFTTVSQITANECLQFLKKKVDFITPNGFENDFVPDADSLPGKQIIAQNKLIDVAENLLDYKYQEKPFLISSSGRYEFFNKGYDLFIDSLGLLNKQNLENEILAFILVPAHNYGPKQGLINRITKNGEDRNIFDNHLSHNLYNAENDPIIKRIYENNLLNRPEDKVKVIFVPSYLNGDDGIFNMNYYDLLVGMDFTAYLSYYEPWGYTPLESIAFGIPTITTSLAGFGKWFETNNIDTLNSVFVINRNDDNANDVVTKAVEIISKNVSLFHNQSKEDIIKQTQNIANNFLWKELIIKYLDAYKFALDQVRERRDLILDSLQNQSVTDIYASNTNVPTWRKFEIQVIMPDRLKGLVELSMNLWWSTNYKAYEMFEYMDAKLWKEKSKNPVVFLKEIETTRLKELEKDSNFLRIYDAVFSNFQKYLQEKSIKKTAKIGYFSMEYGFNDNIKIFSGGLGILAGDYLKGASDNNFDIIGIGLLYKYGYFKQKISVNGEQHAEYIPQDFGKMPLSPVRNENGEQMRISCYFPGRKVYAKIWRVDVGCVPLYLLDTNVEDNNENDRLITSQLYGGDSENRLKQELFLGIGGIRALEALGIKAEIYHCNEGHAAFIGLERIRNLMHTENLQFDEAKEFVKASTLFTTHTPVPAGHDTFEENLIRTYLSHFPQLIGITWEELMKLGRLNSNDKFSMSYLAANLSQEINGVSMLHGKVSQEMFKNLWNGYFAEENHIGYVTNGVHYNTWTAKEWKALHEKAFGPEYIEDLSNTDYWKKIYNVDNKEIWEIRQQQRTKLIDYVKNRLSNNSINQYDDPKSVVKVLSNLDKNTLTIGFARRFATYKRGDLLFRNIERLSEILNNKEKPVQIIFAGKAHPNDGGGQSLIKRIVEMSKRPEFLGKIVFIEDYNISLAEKLVQGVDIWLNTPTRPLEASGTSGMKAVMNGALHFSVLDGWWVEGYRKNAGWALSQNAVYENNESQNELDAQTIYNIIEKEITPIFYNRDKDGIPNEWICYIKNSIGKIVPNFTIKRMIDDYNERYYKKLYERKTELSENNFDKAKIIAKWKSHIAKNWSNIKIVSAKFPDYEKIQVNQTNFFEGEIEIFLGNLSPEDIGVEVLISYKELNNNKIQLSEKYPGILKKTNDNIAKYIIKGNPQHSGIYNYAIRVFAKNNLLPYQQDSGFVLWV